MDLGYFFMLEMNLSFDALKQNFFYVFFYGTVGLISRCCSLFQIFSHLKSENLIDFNRMRYSLKTLKTQPDPCHSYAVEKQNLCE